MAKPKNEFDKDYIYNLIMPSAATDEDHTPTQSAPAPAVQPEDASSNAILALKQRLFSRKPDGPVSISAAAKQEKGLINLVEILVADQIDPLFQKFNCCRCDKCRKDIAAFALNMLPPEYVVASEDELPALLALHSSKEISIALVKAVLQVRAHPNH